MLAESFYNCSTSQFIITVVTVSKIDLASVPKVYFSNVNKEKNDMANGEKQAFLIQMLLNFNK